jgi:RHS repeat-associated protein
MVGVSTDRRAVPQVGIDVYGITAWSAQYQPFGFAYDIVTSDKYTGPVTQNLRLLGQYSDAETGFYQNGARDYMPSWGRYLESDPIGLGGGVNSFGYASQNPLGLTDMNGTSASSTLMGTVLACAENPLCRAAAMAAAAAVCKAAKQAAAATQDAINSILNNDEAPDSDPEQTTDRPPAGSQDIDETPWSGDHQGIKNSIGAGADDNVQIDPSGNIWVENPDGSWSNKGPAGDFTPSGQPAGQSGSDREPSWKENQRNNPKNRKW